MKHISKYEIDLIVDQLLCEKDSLKSRKQINDLLENSYTDTQRERIWCRYRYRWEQGREKSEERHL